jgi:hypothetical protein
MKDDNKLTNEAIRVIALAYAGTRIEEIAQEVLSTRMWRQSNTMAWARWEISTGKLSELSDVPRAKIESILNPLLMSVADALSEVYKTNPEAALIVARAIRDRIPIIDECAEVELRKPKD